MIVIGLKSLMFGLIAGAIIYVGIILTEK